MATAGSSRFVGGCTCHRRATGLHQRGTLTPACKLCNAWKIVHRPTKKGFWT